MATLDDLDAAMAAAATASARAATGAIQAALVYSGLVPLDQIPEGFARPAVVPDMNQAAALGSLANNAAQATDYLTSAIVRVRGVMSPNQPTP